METSTITEVTLHVPFTIKWMTFQCFVLLIKLALQATSSTLANMTLLTMVWASSEYLEMGERFMVPRTASDNTGNLVMWTIAMVFTSTASTFTLQLYFTLMWWHAMGLLTMVFSCLRVAQILGNAPLKVVRSFKWPWWSFYTFSCSTLWHDLLNL